MYNATLKKQQQKNIDYEHYKFRTVRDNSDCGKLQRCQKNLEVVEVEVVNK